MMDDVIDYGDRGQIPQGETQRQKYLRFAKFQAEIFYAAIFWKRTHNKTPLESTITEKSDETLGA